MRLRTVVKITWSKLSLAQSFETSAAGLNFPSTSAVVGFLIAGWIIKNAVPCTFWVILWTFGWGFITPLRGHGYGKEREGDRWKIYFSVLRFPQNIYRVNEKTLKCFGFSSIFLFFKGKVYHRKAGIFVSERKAFVWFFLPFAIKKLLYLGLFILF